MALDIRRGGIFMALWLLQKLIEHGHGPCVQDGIREMASPST